MNKCHGCAAGCAIDTSINARHAPPHVVAIVGPPNSGKSTLFNRLTGLRQKVANFPGVTVEHHIGRAKVGIPREVILVDLPGV
jgi:ferrous iron transport protein B